MGAVVRACEGRGVPLMVLGATLDACQYWSQLAVRLTNAHPPPHSSGIPSALIDDLRDAEGQPLTRSDGLHLIPTGHRFVAERPYEAGVGELARHPREPPPAFIIPR